jgi:hypothetical protein
MDGYEYDYRQAEMHKAHQEHYTSRLEHQCSGSQRDSLGR